MNGAWDPNITGWAYNWKSGRDSMGTVERRTWKWMRFLSASNPHKVSSLCKYLFLCSSLSWRIHISNWHWLLYVFQCHALQKRRRGWHNQLRKEYEGRAHDVPLAKGAYATMSVACKLQCWCLYATMWASNSQQCHRLYATMLAALCSKDRGSCTTTSTDL